MQYHWLSALSFLTAVFLSGSNFAMSLVPWDDMQVKHTWAAAPVDWEILGHPSAGTTLNLYISLKSDRENALKDTLHEVSNPRNPRHVPSSHLRSRLYSRVPLRRFRYGAYLSKAQVAELVRPHPNTLELISAWLKHHGIRSSSVSTTHGGAWLTISDVLVSQANRLLGASYRIYRKRDTNETIIRTVGYALPAVLHAHIQTVTPTTHFASMRVTRQTERRRSFGGTQAQTQEMSGALVTSRYLATNEIFPSLLRWLYGSYNYDTAAEDRNSLGIAGFDEFPSQGDLNKFNTELHTGAYAETFEIVELNGVVGPYSRNPGWEANLGIQYAGGMAYPTPLVFYNTGLDGDPFLALLRTLTDDEDTPQTISIAYTLGDEEKVPPNQAIPICDLFMQLGARGVSVLIGSGSNGVGEGDCKDMSGNDRFLPDFPASCTCGPLPLLPKYHTTARTGRLPIVSQVPMSLVSAEPQAIAPRSRRASPEAASRLTLHALPTRTAR